MYNSNRYKRHARGKKIYEIKAKINKQAIYGRKAVGVNERCAAKLSEVPPNSFGVEDADRHT